MGVCFTNKRYREEKILSNYPISISYEQMKYIQKQMENCICKIKISKGGKGTGFFCKIPFDEKTFLSVLITNNHILDKDEINIIKKIEFTVNQDKKSYTIFVDNNRITYTSIKYDITIIEIKPKDYLDISLLEIDNLIFKNNSQKDYKQKSIYIIQYPLGINMEVSSGIIKNISSDKYNMEHLCPTKEGSSGSPILNLLNYKVIGVHKGSKEGKNWNLGTFIKEPIEEFKNYIKNKNINIINNNIIDIEEIIIQYKNIKGALIKLFGDKFVENNKNLCIIIINDVENELCSHFNLENIKLNNDILEIKLKGIKNITNVSYMFHECKNLFSLPNIHKWNTYKIKDMSFMFYECPLLTFISDISKWNTINVNDLSYMFYNCSSLNNLPDITKWNLINVKKVKGMFYGCTSLSFLPNFSKINLNDNVNINDIFSEKEKIFDPKEQSLVIQTCGNIIIENDLEKNEKNYQNNEIECVDELLIYPEMREPNEVQKLECMEIIVKKQ